jgi:hypothetical protein
MWTLVRVRYAIASPEQVDDLRVYDDAESADFLVDDHGSFVRLGARARRVLGDASAIPCALERGPERSLAATSPTRRHARPGFARRSGVSGA